MIKFKDMAKAVLAVVTVAALVACGGGKEDVAQPDAKEVLTVGTEAGYPPFEMIEGGEIVGFDIDIIKAIAEESDFAVDVQHLGWEGTLEGVEKGKVDLAIAAISKDSEREKRFDFSDSYFEAIQMILVREDSTVTSFTELEGKNIGVQGGTTADGSVQEKFGKTYQGLKAYEDIPSAIDDLLNGRLDAIVADDFVIKEFIKKMGDQGLKPVEDPQAFSPEFFGVIAQKGNSELLTKINDGLKKIQENGKYDEIYKKYFPEE
ncbi:hypothetical protein BEP19_14725 [Ammoniphilus oxalaticus]|uniref:ABC transporter substrate-binding protein n=1 Tax=Ammoniphilus oxalaticus TaxID=66863 RepID=A0A419SEV1_9BACL|nr:basic amino acid ABC transporter substrate-binding protein [Ammoniphilus oxalaticus]RKD21856.1 hypothetical protein BEP19_14725 [Ammoniphilus oxalaticus]